MYRAFRIVLWLLGALVVLGISFNVRMKGLAKDDGGANRPGSGSYTWAHPESESVKPKTPRGGQRLWTQEKSNCLSIFSLPKIKVGNRLQDYPPRPKGAGVGGATLFNQKRH